MMKKLIIILVGILLSFLVVYSLNLESNEPLTDQSSDFESISSGSTSSGDVSIELTPYEISNGKLIIGISANTHSVDLSQFDLMKITYLEYDGKTISPTSALELRGHHSSGEIIFDTGKELNKFTVIIKSIPKVEERKFTWEA